MLDRALEEMQKKESKIMSPSLRLQDQLVDVRRWHPRNRSSSPRWLSSAWFPGFSQARGKKTLLAMLARKGLAQVGMGQGLGGFSVGCRKASS